MKNLFSYRPALNITSVFSFFKTSVCQNQVVNDFLMPDDNWSKKKNQQQQQRENLFQSAMTTISARSAPQTHRGVSQYTCDMYAFDKTCWMFHFFYLGVGLYCWFLIFFLVSSSRQCSRVCL